MLKSFLVLSVFVCLASSDCLINLRGNVTHDKAPLLLQAKGSIYTLLDPNGPNFRWKNGGDVLLGCANGKNTITELNTNFANLTCSRNQDFRSKDRTVQYSKLNCSSSISSSIKAQNRPCAGGVGRWFDVGFEVLGVPFVKYFQVCYNVETLSVIYTEHELLGGSIEKAQINNDRPSFRVGGLKSKIRFPSTYTQNSQRARLETLLGSAELANKYISSSSFFARGHLTPDGDAVLNTWAGATYFYINAAPEWQVINVGNWVRVENAARKVAARLNDTVKIFTGVFDVLTLPDVRGRPVPITLTETNQVEAPKWIWKVVHHPGSDSAIALVTLNNPFAENSVKPLCNNLCAENGWDQQEFQELRKGFTFCCTVRDLRKVISFIPTKADARNILRFN